MFQTVSGEAYAPVADFLVSADTLEYQSAAAFAKLGDGGFVAVWTDSRYGVGSMRMQRFDLNGVKVGPEIVLPAGGTPELAPTPTGGFLLTWTVGEAYPTNSEVRARFYDSNLNPTGPEIPVNTTTVAFQENKSVAALAGGGYIITWGQRGDGGFDHVRGQILDSAGNKIGGEIIVTENVPGSKYAMGLTALAGGGFVAAWSGFEVADQFGNLSPGLRAQVFDSAGNKVGAAFSLNTIVPGTQSSANLASLPGGGFVATWADDGGRQSGGPPNGNQGIWVQLFDGAGLKVGAAVHTGSDGDVPTVVTTTTGFLAVWRDLFQLHAQRFDFDGNEVAEQFVVGTTPAGRYDDISGIVLDSGAILLGWSHTMPSGFTFEDVRAQLLFPVVHGTEGEDSFSGTASRDFFLGKGADDFAQGAAGDDNLDGGDGDDFLSGGTGDDMLDGGAANDFLLLQDGGDDSAYGGDGNDVIYFGNGLSAGDVADGGAGRDAVVLQGNVTAVLTDTNLVGIESISIQSGANSFFGDTANNFYDFSVTTANGNVLAGQQLIVNAQSLRAGEDFTFDGSAETDGKFLVYGGHGVDDLTGGDGVDVFFFEGQRWGSSDRVDGGAGRDSLVVSAGSGVAHIEFGADALTNIESISLNKHFASDPSQKPSYELVLHDGNVAPGGTLIVNGSSLADPTQTVSVDGRTVTGGKLILYGGAGNDELIGGAGGDILYGAGGADELTGGSGADRYEYHAISDSVPGAADLIHFVGGEALIDLSRIDASTLRAGNQAFQWIGSNPFSPNPDPILHTGQLRAVQSNGIWFVEGDVNADGIADFALEVMMAPSPFPLGANHFIL